MTDHVGQRDPNARGYYGDYGGKLVQRSSLRSRSWRGRISTRAATPHSWPSSTACSLTTSVARHRCTRRSA